VRRSRTESPGLLHDTIGHGYQKLRRPDPRIAAAIARALGPAASVANVGAGAGSYEPRDRNVGARARGARRAAHGRVVILTQDTDAEVFHRLVVAERA